MATLKLCLMVHVEDSEAFDSDKAYKLADLATRVSSAGSAGAGIPYGAKLSVQFGRQFLDYDMGNHYDPSLGPTDLQGILVAGGNFWLHTHDGSSANVQSTGCCVWSAFWNERSGTSETNSIGAPIGRSGGWASDGSDDWVTNTFANTMYYMNSAVMGANANVPTTLRPYGFSNDDLSMLYPKAPAPGPIDSDVATMRMRPFYVEVTSNWFAQTNTIGFGDATVGSIVMIPAAGNLDITRLVEKRTAFRRESLSVADLNAAVTQVWTTFQLMSNQPGVTNVWYTHIPFRELDETTSNITIAAMVTTITDLLTMPTSAQWLNMNEIGSTFRAGGI